MRMQLISIVDSGIDTLLQKRLILVHVVTIDFREQG